MLVTFENGVTLMRYGASVVWHHSLLLLNSFNKAEAAVFLCRLCFLGAFSFISLMCISHHRESLLLLTHVISLSLVFIVQCYMELYLKVTCQLCTIKKIKLIIT